MISYIRARLRERPVAGGHVTADTADGDVAASVIGDSGGLVASDRVLLAQAAVRVGVRTQTVTALLGPWPDGAADPAGPLGLSATPVLAVAASWMDLALAGVRRAGRGPAIMMVGRDAPSLGLRLLDGVRDGAEVVAVEDGSGAHLWLARALGGRPLAALPLDDPGAIRQLVADLDLDVHVPVPSCDEPTRGEIRAVLEPLGLETLHHLVETDPIPAFREIGLDPAEASLDALSAAAAGVLAGRMAIGNRRWRSELGA
ncbi:MAG: hypothetical protein M3O29_01710 [Actinomycetota bacterium]|nr:hypothetical protein [Actinomycetota bacterium]